MFDSNNLVIMKHCSRCDTNKNEVEFYKSKNAKDGLQTWCKPCVSETQKVARLADPNKGAEWSRKSYYKNHAENKERVRKATNKWNAANPEKAKRMKFEAKLKKYKISEKQYDDMLNSQNGACAICAATPLDIRENLSIDHCHLTGSFRGLLCRKCNLAIGLLKDRSELALSAAKYLAI